MRTTSYPPVPKLVIFGIDGADFQVMSPWLDQGLLPNLASVMARGASGPLRSVIPPLTPPAWTTIMTGVNPGRHGIMDFVLPRAHSYGRRLCSTLDCRAPLIWTLLNGAGHTCGVFNVPFSYPPTEVDGYVMAGGMGSPHFKEAIFRPRSLFSELRGAVGDLPMDPVVDTRGHFDLATLDRLFDRTAAACRYLMSEHPTDVFIGVVGYVDHLQHAFYGKRPLPGDEDRVPDMLLYGYQAADRLLGEVLGRCGDETHVLVVSDHGAGPLKGYLNIERLLQEAGLLRARRNLTAAGRVRKCLDEPPPWLAGLLPARVRRRLARGMPEQLESGIDWQGTTVFVRRPSGGLCLNVRGREPEGIISPADYERVRDEVIEVLGDAFARYPELQPVQLHRREELYHGPALEAAADIIYSLDNFTVQPTCCRHPEAGTVLTLKEAQRLNVFDASRTGWHGMDGVFVAAGPKVAAGATPHHAELAHVTPTALELLDVTVDQDFDGRVLAEILVPEAQAVGVGAAAG